MTAIAELWLLIAAGLALASYGLALIAQERADGMPAVYLSWGCMVCALLSFIVAGVI